MDTKKKMRIGIKIGSSLLTNGNGIIYTGFIEHLCAQIAQLKEMGNEPFLVTSGAVHSDCRKDRCRNLRAAVGMARLITHYSFFLEKYGIDVAQMLLTYGAFKHPYLLRDTFEQAFKEGVLPVINYNDVIDDKELEQMSQGADNDNLFKQVCFLVEADAAIIGTSEKGLYDFDGKTVHLVRQFEHKTIMKFAQGKSETGYQDGMKTKAAVLFELSGKGIKTILAPGKEEYFILRALERLSGDNTDFGTMFLHIP